MITHKIYRTITLLIITCSIFSSCVREELDVVSAEGNVSFKLVTKEDEEVETRSNAYESSINDVYLIVVDFTTTPNKFIECKPATRLTNAGDYVASLTPRRPPVTIWAVANVAPLVKAKMSQWVPGTTSADQIKEDLLTDELGRSGDGVIAMPELPPFFGEQKEIVGIGNGAALKFMMTRATAKITMGVSGDAQNDGFTVIGANMYNAPVRGYVGTEYEDTTSIERANYMGVDESGKYTSDLMITKATEDDPLYCYESLLRSGTANPYLIIQSNRGYYRVNLIDAVGQQIALQRNYHYKINIAKVLTDGAKTAEDAVKNPPLNADILINDPNSHEIITNGVDYMGLSNSELIIYDSYASNEFNYDAKNNEEAHYGIYNGYVATVLTYKSRTPVKITATECKTESDSGAQIRFRTTSINIWEKYTGLENPDWGEIVNELELPATTEVVEGRNIVINLPHDFRSGKIKITMGSLQKEILITRNDIVSLIGDVLDMGAGFSMAKIDFEKKFMPGSGNTWGNFPPDITTELDGNPGYGPTDLIRFTKSHDGNSGTKTLSLQAGEHLYVKVNPVNGDVNTIYKSVQMFYWAASEFSMTRASNQARVKVHLVREPFMDGTRDNAPVYSQYSNYLSAYWRNNETGERIIKVPRMLSPQYWTVRVLYGQDFIRLAYLDGRTSAEIEAGNAEEYQPDNSWKLYLQQPFTTESPYGNKYPFPQFRIGLTSKNPSKKTRYGLVAFMFPTAWGGGEGVGQTFLIFVRQGEEPDYIFSPSEEYNGAARVYAQAFSPYALSVADTTNNRGGAAFADHKRMNGRGVFAEYPTQQGYDYQWGNDIAIHPSNPVRTKEIERYTYDYSAPYKEICPEGYTLATTDESNIAVTHSFISSTATRLPVGLCADGYYDRLAFKNNTGSISIVGHGAKEANSGYLYFNPKTLASIFIPKAATRPNGINTSSYGDNEMCFWGRSIAVGPHKQPLIKVQSSWAQMQDRKGAFPVRCVKIVHNGGGTVSTPGGTVPTPGGGDYEPWN